jgi:hypothetical protein
MAVHARARCTYVDPEEQLLGMQAVDVQITVRANTSTAVKPHCTYLLASPSALSVTVSVHTPLLPPSPASVPLPAVRALKDWTGRYTELYGATDCAGQDAQHQEAGSSSQIQRLRAC